MKGNEKLQKQPDVEHAAEPRQVHPCRCGLWFETPVELDAHLHPRSASKKR